MWNDVNYGQYGAQQVPYMPTMQNNPYTIPQQQPQQIRQNQPIVKYVNEVSQAKDVQLYPGTTTLIIVQNQPVIVMASADSMGLITRKYFNLAEFDPEQQTQQVQAQNNNYVTRDEFLPLQQFIQNLQKNLEEQSKNKDEAKEEK